jgi:aldose 1-epimerase
VTGLVTLASADARVEVAPAIGGAIVAFRWRDREVMRPTPAAALAQGDVRLCASFPLVPFSNRIADARLRVGEADFDLARNYPGMAHAIHGVGFQRAWTVVEARADRVMLALDYDPARDEHRAWPFAFRATQAIALRSDARCAALALTLSIESRDARPFPFGLGWHPYFPRDAATVLRFRAAGMWRTGPTLLPETHGAVPADASFEAPRAIGATTLDNVFTGWDGLAALDDAAGGVRVLVEGDTATAFLVVYVPPGRDFLAIEPVTHATDAFNRHARGETGTGTRTLPPGGSFSCTMRIVAQSLSSKAA